MGGTKRRPVPLGHRTARHKKTGKAGKGQVMEDFKAKQKILYVILQLMENHPSWFSGGSEDRLAHWKILL